MTITLISAFVLILTLTCVLVGACRGYSRGIYDSLIRSAKLICAILITALISFMASNAITDLMISFTGIRTEHIDDGIISFAGYARDPEDRSLFEASGEKYRDEEIYIPYNMWMVLCLDPSVRVKDLPDSFVYTSPLLKISFAESLSGGVPSEHIQLSCAQAEYMLETCMRDCALPKEAFKKIDRLEDYLKRTASLKFGNELCVGMEKYSSVCLACGEDTLGALDRTLASRVLSYIAITVSG